MNRFAGLLRRKDKRLAEALDASLRETAFDNRYALHPRRLSELAQEIGGILIRFLEGSSAADPQELGRKLAHEGIGERTIAVLGTDFRRFVREELARNRQTRDAALIALDAFVESLLTGFMTAREEQILADQEQLRRALSRALESQSQELRVKNHAIDTSINGIILASLDGKVTWVNASFLEMWGYPSTRDAIGVRFGDLWIGEDAHRIVQLLPRTHGWRGELAARRANGSVFSVELSASLVKDESGGAIGLMCSVVDVTERKRLQSQILQTQKMDALGQLAGGIAHDFNNLLTAISGYLQLLLFNAPRDTQLYRDLMQIKAAVDRGSGLTQQLRFFTRQAAGARKIISLNDVARETYEIFHHTFPPEITIEPRLAPDLWTVEADPNQMSQVLVNLCVNARDAMLQGGNRTPGGTLTIETRNVELSEEQAARYLNARPGRCVVLRVSDTGVGIAAEALEKLFIPFFTTKGDRSGTGLGLAVVYGIVTSHRGFIDVRSAEGNGSTFEIFLPVTDRPVEQEQGEVDVPTLAPGRGKILVVDDEVQVREVISRALHACGYTVLTAANGHDALERLSQDRDVELVILDMVMPGMAGRECLERIRIEAPQTRVIIATGFTADGSALELLKEGALEILEKPIDLKALVQKVQKLLPAAGAEACDEGGLPSGHDGRT
jgi:two-component system cell cycle sensor histidine kinase/response regulator CckA